MEEPKQSLLTELLRHPALWLFSGGGASLLVQNLFGRMRQRAEAKQVDAGAEITLSKGALEFAQELRKDINAMQERIASLEAENRTLYRRVAELEVENAALKAELRVLRGTE